MFITVGELRALIREETLGGSHPSEAYDKDLTDDPAWKKNSMQVPDKRKKKIKSFLKAMGLSRK